MGGGGERRLCRRGKERGGNQLFFVQASLSLLIIVPSASTLS